MNKVSIIVPCYNSARCVEKAITSLKEQTYGEIEVIVIDDGSDDTTLDAARRAAQNDGRFVFVSLEHAGVSNARNHGIKIATGEYLMFLDADDRYSENGVEKLVRAADRYKADIVSGGLVKTRNSKKIAHMTPTVEGVFSDKQKETVLRKACIGNDPALCSFIDKLYRTEFIRDNNIFFPDIISGEDSVFALDAMMACDSIAFLKDNDFYLYEQNPESFTKKNIAIEERISLSDIFFGGMERIIKKYGREDLLVCLDSRKALAIYDFLMKIAERSDVGSAEKKKMIKAVADNPYYAKGLDRDALSYQALNVRFLVSEVLKKHILRAYFTALFIKTLKKLAGKSA